MNSVDNRTLSEQIKSVPPFSKSIFARSLSGNMKLNVVSPVSSETRVDPARPVADTKTLNLTIHVLALPVTFEPLFHINAKALRRRAFERGVAPIEATVPFCGRDRRFSDTRCPDLSWPYVSHSGQGMKNPFSSCLL